MAGQSRLLIDVHKNHLIFLRYNAAVLKVIYTKLMLFQNKSERFGEIIEI